MNSKISIIIKIILQVVLGILVFNVAKTYIPILSKVEICYYFLLSGSTLLFHLNNIFLLFKKEIIRHIKLFNIYYINYSKVFEICMLINNKRQEKEEFSYKDEYSNKYSIGTSGKLTKSIGEITPNLLNENSNTKTYEYKELQEIKNTNSTYLSEIIDVCKEFNSDTIGNGDLVKIDDVQLEITNKPEIAQINSMLAGVFKDNIISTDSDGQTFNININAITNILLKDYKYSLKGKDSNRKEFYISIPIKAEKEFENEYSIYDLEIGKVNIIGIYRTSDYKYKNINTFNYLQEIGENESIIGDELLKSNISSKSVKGEKKIVKNNLPYIDLIAIIQDLDMKEDVNNE